MEEGVITMEDWVTIRNLKAKNPNMGTREIARILKVCRNTVKQALKDIEVPKYARRSASSEENEKFREYIFEQINVKKKRKSVVFEEIKSKGYRNSRTVFYEYASSLLIKEVKTFQRYETQPGEQAQFDWSEYTVMVGGILTKIYIFIYLLGFSRYRTYCVSLSQDLSSVFEAIEEGFHKTGGVPERIQTDNAKCFVSQTSKDDFHWNKHYLALADHYSVQPTRSKVRHPWSKGKVENPFDYLQDHFIQGKEFESFEDLRRQLSKFEEEVNSRVHQTTQKTPLELLSMDTNALGKLPEKKFISVKQEHRKATYDCLISYKSNKYSVPQLFAGKEVWLKVSKGYLLEIYSSQALLIATHRISGKKGSIIINKEHYINHKIDKGNLQRVETRFLELFPEELWFLEKIKTQKKLNAAYQLTKILGLTDYYNKEDIRASIAVCYKYNTFSYSFIRGCLEKDFRVSETSLPLETITKIPQVKESIKRSLNYYKI